MKQTKHILATIAMLLCSLAASAYSFEVDGIYYNITNSSDLTVEVTYEAWAYYDEYDHYFSPYGGDVVIPENVNYNGNIYCVTEIGDHAFDGCSSLTSITIPESVTSIGGSAFYNCSSLTSITIPEGVASIGDYAFSGTPWYNTWYNNQPNGVIYIGKVLYEYKGTMAGNTSIEVREGTVSISPSAFSGCSSLTSITLPESVTSIGGSAFYNCSSLTSITISESVTSIGYSAFSKCSSLTSITIPENSKLTSIGNRAFEDCNSLTSINIPESVTSIGDDAFDGTPWYNNQPDGVVYVGKMLYEYKGTMPANTSIEVREGTVSINEDAFSGCGGLSSVTIPESMKSIGDDAFNGCSSLARITIPEGVTSIGEDAFYNCSSLTAVHISGIESWCKISFGGYSSNPLNYAHKLYLNGELVTELVIPEGVTEIRSYAFDDCSSLTSITIPESVISIGSSAFYGCSSLARITIPEGVTSIGNNTFSGCSSLARITIPEGVTSIGNYAFSGCSSLARVTIPESVTKIGDNAFYKCSSLTSITIPENSQLTSIEDEAFSFCSSLTSITIPEGVTEIGSLTFYNCSRLTSITIPEGVTSIGQSTFFGCSSLTSVTIPENSQLTSIGWRAFYGCRLTSITIPEGVTSIEDDAFYGCSLRDVNIHISSIESWLANNLSSSLGLSYSLYLDGALLSCVEIPSSVASIPNYAFYDCKNITSVIIPESVTEIGERAFMYCSKLITVSFPESLSIIKKQAFYNCKSLESIVIPEGVEFIYQEAFASCSALESVKVLATEPPFAYDNTFSNYDIELCVPEEAMEAYRTTAPWSDFTTIRNLEGEEAEVKQCAAPTIDYIDGQVVLTCETQGVTFVSETTASGTAQRQVAVFDLAATYTITAYATKEDYLNSETTTVTLCWIDCSDEHENDDADGIITIPSRPVLIQTNNGVITLTGLAEGTTVTVYDLGGTQQGAATAANGTATITTTLTAGSTAIVKIGNRSIKVVVK